VTAINFNTSNQTLRQLLGNGLTFRVPRFQRDYSWTQDEWEDLWQDMQETLRPGGEPAHYMGYLVLQSQDNRTFDVIDGQQRLTTLSLLALAVLKNLQELADAGVDAENNRRRIDQLRQSYIGYLDPVTLVPRTKLSLNRNNDAYYRDYLVPLQQLPQRGLRASEHLLRKAFDWFVRQVRDQYTGTRSGADLARFLDELSDKLFFTVITVTDELNAFKVFETLNARGVRLSPTDLLKNYLFSVVYRESSHPQEIETLERRWEGMVGRLGGESFPDFLRTHWNSRRRFVRESDLFKTIRAETPDKRKVFDLLREMEQDIDVYVALSNPEDTLWNEEQRRYVSELRMFSVRQPWPLLLAAFRTFDVHGVTELLRVCSVISLRYNVISGLITNEQERTYNGVAQKIAAGEISSTAQTVRALAPIYVSDDAFRQSFAAKVLRTTSARNKRIARYLLCTLEAHLTNHEYDLDSPRYNLEHILPENPGANWPQFSDEQAEAAVYRLGNFAMLESSVNRDLGNRPFAEKRPVYAQSSFELTRRVAQDNEEWALDRLAERQRWMARQATALWRIGQLSAGK
jgi:hypothetical protein